ncbi:MAG TPA: IPT/TIG domain-containing protein [Terriglobia bacterium]|nr:IPT/TIG domain-containing protein [Terriglobia bacterium]
MKSKVSERNLAACVIALLAAVVPLFFAACRSDITSPLDPSTAQQAAAPTIKSIVPDIAPPAGGATVTINGSNFSSSAQATPPSVSFGGVAAKNVRMISSLQLVATVPPHSSGKVNVQVTTADGMSSSVPGAFTYTASSPTVRSVSPTSGGTAGGTVVTVTGSNFASGATVSFGGAPASVSFLSSTQLTAVTPAHAAGSVNVVITNPDSTSAMLAGGFNFGTASSLAVSSVTPNSGGTAGGTVVTVTGSNFASGATVSFGGSAASGVSFVSANQLTATTPPHASGSVSVAVTNPDSTSAALPGGFTFGASSSLAVSSVSPFSGPAAGGTKVTISGANFQVGVSVTFGGLPAASVTLSNASTIVAVTPQHSSGTATVTITNTSGQSASWAKNYTFHSIDLLWDAPSTSPVTIAGYNIYRGNSSAGPFGKLNGSTPLSDTSFNDTTVEGSTTYYYEVKSVDSDGTESAPAGPVPATTSP